MQKFFPARLHWARAAIIALLAVPATLAACSPEALAPLPAVKAKTSETSVSGISSGAYMAGQFEIAHSRLVTGAAIIAGGPYGCAESVFASAMPGPGAAFLNLSKAINGCMLNALMIWGVPNPPLLADKARRLAEDGKIDPIDNVIEDRVYLFAGKEDRTVVPPIVETAYEFYAKLGVQPSHLKHVTGIPAGHAFVTMSEGLACEKTGKPFIVDCDYDQARELLTHIYGTLNPPSEQPTGALMVFDQTPFTQGLGDHGMSDQGVVYVPRACAATGGCRVHIAFHGCAQNRAAVGDAFIQGSGFMRWADTNNLVVLYPQIATQTLNPQGCWDWWGYTGHEYLTREAPQIKAVYRMLERLGGDGPAS